MAVKKHAVQKVFTLGLVIWPGLALFNASDAYAQVDTAKHLKEVKVNSSLLPQTQILTPAQQISATDFIRYNALNVADALRNFSGVNIKDYGGIGGIKTVSVRGLSANHTAVLYDGVQISDAENGQIDLSKFNLNSVQQIVLYSGQPSDICMPARSFAFASTIAVKTVKPILTAAKNYQITAGLKAGSFGLVYPSIQWQQRINDRWSFVINSYLQHANGRYQYRLHGNAGDSLRTRNNADISAQEADGAVYWAKSDSNKFNLHVNYYHSNRGIPGAVILYSTAESLSRLWNEDFFTQSGYEHIWKNGWHLLINSKFSESNLRYLDPTFLNEQGKLDQQFNQQEFYQSASLAYHLAKNWEVSYATDAFINHMNANLPNFSYPTRLSWLNVLASNLIVGRLKLQASILNSNVYETVRSGRPAPDRHNYSPTLMATLQPFKSSNNIQLRAYYKSIFRNPTFNDLYYGGVGNPNLKPEFTKQYDLGATFSKALNGFLSYITFTADAYYNHVTNKIIFIPKDAYNGSIQNFGKVDIKGLDVGVKAQTRFSDTWKGNISVNYTYQQALNITDPTSSIYLNQLPYTPKNTVALNAGVDHKQFGLYYNQVISSSRYYTNENSPADYIPGYSTGDASVIYRFTVNKLPLLASLEANNIFNSNYTIVRSYPMPGRSFRVSFQITV